MANEYLTRTPTSTGNRRVFTISYWKKANQATVSRMDFSAVGNTVNDASNRSILYFSDVGSVDFFNNSAGTISFRRVSNDQHRDFSSFIHVLVRADTTNNIGQVYINGIEVKYDTNFTVNTANFQTFINATWKHSIGMQFETGFPNACQFSDFFLIDGQALTPDVFGFNKTGKGYISAGSTQSTDFRPGQWVPKSPRIIIADINSRGGFGVNGFYLPMNDSNNFGADFHCTPNSIIKLQENLPQPKCRIDGVGDYTGALRDDPFKQYLVLALPFVSNGLQNGFGDYSAAIKGSGSAKTITNSNATISTAPSYYGSAVNFTSSSNSYLTTPKNIEDYNMGSGDFTVEGWVYFKSINTGQYTRFFSIGNTTNEGLCWELNITTSTLSFIATIGADYNAITTTFPIVANQWYHIAQVRKGTSYSAYINGVCIGTDTTTNGNINFNSNTAVVIGAWESPLNSYTRFSDAYMQDLRIYKGVAKYTGGFDVPRPYTPVGISSWRAVSDTTANNFATLNPLSSRNVTFTNGNLSGGISQSTGNAWAVGNIGVSSGKYYWETRYDGSTGAGTGFQVGIVESGYAFNRTDAIRPYQTPFGYSYLTGSSTINNGVSAAYGASWTTGDIIGTALDLDSRTLTFYKNGVSQGIAYSNLSGTFFPVSSHQDTQASGVYNHTVNYGQNPTFSGQVTAGTFTDSNGKGLFKYQPPAGFLALCEDNLSTPAISDPGKHFKTVLYTGDGSSVRTITGLGFKPDLVWVKDRTSAYAHRISDSVRGPLKTLYTDLTNLEATDSNGNISSFDADGFSVAAGATNSIAVNTAGNNYVAWCWKAGGPAVPNTDGTIASQVSVNQTAGFSIVSYTGNGVSGATVGHGLPKTPNLTIIKSRTNNTRPWALESSSFSGRFLMNTTDVEAAFSHAKPYTSKVLTLEGGTTANESGGQFIAYCWTEIQGFSKFGTYVGNGLPDSAFVYCGFKPAWVMIKAANSTNSTCINGGFLSWAIYDNTRDSVNPAGNNNRLYANRNYAEGLRGNGTADGGFGVIDFLSNGFKIRAASNCENNVDGATHIFVAFAESPFQTANAK